MRKRIKFCFESLSFFLWSFSAPKGENRLKPNDAWAIVNESPLLYRLRSFLPIKPCLSLENKNLHLAALRGCIFASTLFMMVPSCWAGENKILPQVVGHRGAAGLMPENTLAGFREALRLRVDALELDVRLTKDGQVVVHHDPCLNKDITCDREGERLKKAEHPIRDMTYDEIRHYTVGVLDSYSLYAQKYPRQIPVENERVPLLKDVLLLAQKTKTPVYIEMKTDVEGAAHKLLPLEDVQALVKGVAHVIKECEAVDHTYAMSFDWRAPIHLQEYAPEVKTCFVTVENGYHDDSVWRHKTAHSPWLAGYNVHDFGGSIPKMIKAAGGQGWNPFYRDLTKEDVMEAHALGLKVVVWTPNTKRALKKMIDMGVDGITTNHPDLLLQLLEG